MSHTIVEGSPGPPYVKLKNLRLQIFRYPHPFISKSPHCSAESQASFIYPAIAGLQPDQSDSVYLLHSISGRKCACVIASDINP